MYPFLLFLTYFSLQKRIFICLFKKANTEKTSDTAVDENNNNIESTISSKKTEPAKPINQEHQVGSTTTSTTTLRRTDSKLVKTPKPSVAQISATISEISSSSSSSSSSSIKCTKSLDNTDDQLASAKTSVQTVNKVKDLVPDTTERLPHTRQLSSAALQLSPRHHPNLLTKLGTAHAHHSSSNDSANTTTSSASGSSSSSSSSSSVTSSTVTGGVHLALNKCPSLASVSSYYLPNDETVVNTSDEYYEEDTEEDDQADRSQNDDGDQEEDNEVFTSGNGNGSHRTANLQQVIFYIGK